MNNQQPNDPVLPLKEKLDELIAGVKKARDMLAPYAKGAEPRKRKLTKSEKEANEKFLIAEKALELAFDHQELLPPGFLEKFWEDKVRCLQSRELYETNKQLLEMLEQICPEAANYPSTTKGTTNSV
jgi:hypothetical protein